MSQNSRNVYVFFFVGDDVSQPQMLVDTIRWVDPNSEVVHCADAGTPHIAGVSRRAEVKGDRARLMTYRLKAFAESGVDRPAIYVDTDMLCLRAIDSVALSRQYPVRFCSRQFAVDAPFNGRFRGMDFTEYDKQPLGVVYPYVACATVTPDAGVWGVLGAVLDRIEPKFSIWYGDQEAIKRFCSLKGINPSHGLPETLFGCLPEYSNLIGEAYLLHYKGPSRKALMSDQYATMRRKLNTNR